MSTTSKADEMTTSPLGTTLAFPAIEDKDKDNDKDRDTDKDIRHHMLAFPAEPQLDTT